MTLMPWRELLDPDRPIAADFRKLMQQALRDIWDRGEAGGALLARPRMDVVRTDDHYHVEVELPGMSKEDVEVRLDDDVLVISASKEEKVEKKEGDYLFKERSEKKYERRVRLPGVTDGDGLQAECSDGLLKLELPIKEPAKSHKIEVK